MQRILLTALLVVVLVGTSSAQYRFTDEINIECTGVKNQQRTGTCWSFATTSFLESEVVRLGNEPVDLAEMFNVRMTYEDKARNYVLRQGKAQFSQGSLAHDVLRTVDEFGLVPQSAYPGLMPEDRMYDHGELESAMSAFLDAVIATGRPGPHWDEAIDGILDAYLGAEPASFNYGGRAYTPKSFAAELGLEADNYVSITSFTHHPFYEKFILEIPDNYANGAFFNVPLDEMQAVVDYALENGFSVGWDGDVSEKGFSQAEGIAIMPEDPSRANLFSKPAGEETVDQASRQAAFENYQTTDDHLMHLIGRATDQEGNRYYIIKNSWGEVGPYNGLLYMSEAYFRAKTVFITVHEDAVPNATRERM